MTRRSRPNCGATRLRRRQRPGDPMHRYDALPQPLRRWMAEAARPWSPSSCLSIWQKVVARGGSVEDALDRLDRAERALLARDGLQ